MHRRRLVRALGLTALAAFFPPIPGWSADTRKPALMRWRSPLLHNHPLAGRIWDAASERFVPTGALIESLRHAYFRLLGEVHDNPDHHAIQAELLEAIAAGGLKPVVAFEQFDREFDAVLQQRLVSGKLGPDDVAAAVHFDYKGWNWDFYRPLVAIALRHGMPLRAANLSRKAAAEIAKKGMAALEPSRIAALRLESAWNTEREQALREIIREGHCGALPESILPAMAAAQRVRDATMAETLLEASRDGAVLIAGNGHVRRDLAVPIYLAAAAAAEKSSCAVGILEVDAEEQQPEAYLQSAASRVPLYDFVCFTPRWDRPDPCAAFSTPGDQNASLKETRPRASIARKATPSSR